jgi:RNA polymerase sigma factor (sigma-70 family)
MIVVYRRVGDIRSPAALGAWLVRVVARLCALPVLMFMRSVEELKTIEDSARFAYVPVDQLRMDVARALAALPDKYRQIILLRDLEEMTISEIARRLTISGEAAKSLLRRARAAARQHLTERAT